MREIEGWIRSGRFPPGERLPAERELANRVDTSRNVLREALKVLETKGLVTVRHGIGTFVAENLDVAELVIPVKLEVEPSQIPVEELVLARRVIECAIAEVAARARDRFDLEELRKLVDELADAQERDDSKRFVAADLEFHAMLGRCTHNRLLAGMQAEMTKATSTVRNLASDTHDAARAAVHYHREILEACTRGDGEAARAVMLLHLIDAGERLMGAVADSAQAEPPKRERGE